MRLCRALKTKEVVQPVIDQLVDYGYLAEKQMTKTGAKGRQTIYLVNECIYDEE